MEESLDMDIELGKAIEEVLKKTHPEWKPRSPKRQYLGSHVVWINYKGHRFRVTIEKR